MKTLSALLMAVGLLMTLAAFNMQTGVYSYGGDVNNLGLLQHQIMVLQTGLAAFIAGSVLLAGSPALPSNAKTSVARSTIARMEETEDEREERLAGVRRFNRNIGIAIGGVILFIVIAALIQNAIG